MTESSRPATAPAAAHARPIRDAIERWFAAHIHNSPVSRSVEALNHLRATIDRLEDEIVEAIKKEI